MLLFECIFSEIPTILEPVYVLFFKSIRAVSTKRFELPVYDELSSSFTPKNE